MAVPGVRKSSAKTTPASSSDREILRLISELYYLRDLRQPEIAALTGFSVSKVSRILAQAREKGVVLISIEPVSEGPSPAAQALSSRYGVTVVTTPGREAEPAAAARLCGLAAAEHVAALLPARGALGVAGGYTMDALASALPRVEMPDLTVVPVVGGWDSRNRYLDVNELARRVADRLGAQVHYLHAPGMLDSELTKAALLLDSGVAATTGLWATLAVALLGISGGPTLHPGYGTVMDRLDEPSRRRLLELGVVGDLSGHLFREDGQIIEHEWSRRTIAISVDELRKIPEVMAVAAGSNKHRSILGSLRTGIVKRLFTDRSTAEQVLALDDRTRSAGRSESGPR